MKKPSPEKQMELINTLGEICQELGWVIGVPEHEDPSTVPGLIIGKEDFVYELAAVYGDEVEVFSQDSTETNMKELPSSDVVKAKKRESMH